MLRTRYQKGQFEEPVEGWVEVGEGSRQRMEWTHERSLGHRWFCWESKKICWYADENKKAGSVSAHNGDTQSAMIFVPFIL